MNKDIKPEHTAVRVALWRALHVLIDDAPHVFTDELGAKIVGESNWTQRQDMDPNFSRQMRASIVARARFIEDLVLDKIKEGIDQYVILGAGLDTFALRNSNIASKIQIFEVDEIGPQLWKQKRLNELNLSIPSGLHFVPIDFESKHSLWEELNKYGFDNKRPAIIVSTGVSMYLSHEANVATFKEIANLAPGSTFAMTFLLSLDLLESEERKIMEFVMERAKESGTPFLSLFSPHEIKSLALNAGFKIADCINANELFLKYFNTRNDGLSAGKAENFLVATN